MSLIKKELFWTAPCVSEMTSAGRMCSSAGVITVTAASMAATAGITLNTRNRTSAVDKHISGLRQSDTVVHDVLIGIFRKAGAFVSASHDHDRDAADNGTAKCRKRKP